MSMDLGSVYVPTATGEFVHENHHHVAQIIKDYDPNMELIWIPPSRREPGDMPFAVVHRPVGRPAYIAMYANDDEINEVLLTRVFMSDTTRNDVMGYINARNAAVKSLHLHKQMEAAEEAADKAKHILASPKSSYSVDDIIIHSDKPAEKRSRPKVL